MKKLNKYNLFVITIILITGCIEKIDLNIPYHGFDPVPMNDGWSLSDPQSENMDKAILEKAFLDFYNENRYPTIRSLIIVRNCKLVAEAYCKKESDREDLHNTMSVTKSISSILTGIAIDKGLIDSVTTPVYKYLSDYFDADEVKRSITIEQVLSMETGLEFDNDKHASELFALRGNSLEYVLHKDLVFTPGTSWYYGNGNPHIISGIITEITGLSEAEFAQENLFKPLGISNYQWESLHDGLTYGAQGLWLTPRDMARIGLLMANSGKWNDKQVVSENWVHTSTKRQSDFQNYGYFWYPIDDKAFYAEGHGGQLIWVYPEKKLVVIITSDPYTKSWNLSEPYTDLFSEILSSLKD
jgi:CubicO group peptidase (beta-lactamase class C family)